MNKKVWSYNSDYINSILCFVALRRVSEHSLLRQCRVAWRMHSGD